MVWQGIFNLFWKFTSVPQTYFFLYPLASSIIVKSVIPYPCIHVCMHSCILLVKCLCMRMYEYILNISSVAQKIKRMEEAIFTCETDHLEIAWITLVICSVRSYPVQGHIWCWVKWDVLLEAIYCIYKMVVVFLCELYNTGVTPPPSVAWESVEDIVFTLGFSLPHYRQ